MRVDEIFEHTRPLFRWQQADMQLTPLVVAREASAVLHSFLATLVKRDEMCDASGSPCTPNTREDIVKQDFGPPPSKIAAPSGVIDPRKTVHMSSGVHSIIAIPCLLVLALSPSLSLSVSLSFDGIRAASVCLHRGGRPGRWENTPYRRLNERDHHAWPQITRAREESTGLERELSSGHTAVPHPLQMKGYMVQMKGYIRYSK